ncbi:MAG TPA: hypothetical protein ENK57_05930 [Polyangiaceae bacterium]|nr:hypothetical protein [Polyangiaceae bacterium]
MCLLLNDSIGSRSDTSAGTTRALGLSGCPALLTACGAAQAPATAAASDEARYFGHFAEDGVFLGTEVLCREVRLRRPPSARS